MFAQIHLERFRRLAIERAGKNLDVECRSSDHAVTQDSAAMTLVPTVPANKLAGKPTCRCGRYWLEPTLVMRWTIDPVTLALEAHERVEIRGRVTPRELVLWRNSLQTLCADSICNASDTLEMQRSPDLSPHAGQELLTASEDDPVL